MYRPETACTKSTMRPSTVPMTRGGEGDDLNVMQLSDYLSENRLLYEFQTGFWSVLQPPPPYMKDMFTSRQEQKQSLRNEHQLNIPFNFSRTVGFGSHSIQLEGARVWNHLPNKIRGAENLAAFKKNSFEHGEDVTSCAICTIYF